MTLFVQPPLTRQYRPIEMGLFVGKIYFTDDKYSADANEFLWLVSTSHLPLLLMLVTAALSLRLHVCGTCT